MSFDPAGGTVRDRVRLTLGDIQDPPGFSSLSVTGTMPLLPQLTEAVYDSLITLHGPKKAAVIILGWVLQQLPNSYSDASVSENLAGVIDSIKQLRQDIQNGVIEVEGAYDKLGAFVAGRKPMTHPVLEPFGDI